MWRKICLVFVVAVISGTIMSIIEVDAHSIVNESAFCESYTFDKAVNLIKQGMSNVALIREHVKAVKLIREDLEDVKNVLASSQQQNNVSCVSKNDFEDLKAAFDASSQQQKLQNNASSTLKKDLEDLKAACASNQQQCPQTELPTSKQALASSFLCEYTTRITHF